MFTIKATATAETASAIFWFRKREGEDDVAFMWCVVEDENNDDDDEDDVSTAPRTAVHVTSGFPSAIRML